jgi:hypothetical protein
MEELFSPAAGAAVQRRQIMDRDRLTEARDRCQHVASDILVLLAEIGVLERRVAEMEASLRLKESQKPPERDTDFLTTAEAANWLNVNAQTLRVWRYRGGGPAYHKFGSGPGGRVLYRIRDIEDWLADRRYEHTAEEAVNRER